MSCVRSRRAAGVSAAATSSSRATTLIAAPYYRVAGPLKIGPLGDAGPSDPCSTAAQSEHGEFPFRMPVWHSMRVCVGALTWGHPMAAPGTPIQRAWVAGVSAAAPAPARFRGLRARLLGTACFTGAPPRLGAAGPGKQCVNSFSGPRGQRCIGGGSPINTRARHDDDRAHYNGALAVNVRRDSVLARRPPRTLLDRGLVINMLRGPLSVQC